jgi:RNA polymerase sigma-70 factor (ECF subfamily)
LEDQDRSLWDRAAVEEGKRHLAEARQQDEVGPYQLQAAIAGCHASAPTAEATDWRSIAGLYQQLADLTGSPIVELNRAVAVAMTDGPEEGLALVDELARAGALDGYYLLPAARADMLRRLGRFPEAVAAYREALALVRTEPERRFLEARVTEADARL